MSDEQPPSLVEKLAAPAAPWSSVDDLPPLPEKLRERLLDRLEAGWADGTLSVDVDTYEQILFVLLPEDFLIRRPTEPDTAPPGSSARVETYARRAAGGQLFLEADRKAIAGDKREGKVDRDAVKARDRGNHTGVVPIDWNGEDDEIEVKPGLYRTLTGDWFELN